MNSIDNIICLRLLIIGLMKIVVATALETVGKNNYYSCIVPAGVTRIKFDMCDSNQESQQTSIPSMSNAN